MTDVSSHSVSAIEQDIQRSRTRVADNMRELRERISPGQLTDELLAYARTSTGAEFTRNLGRSVVDNPLPLLLIGAGMTWLMTSSNGRPHAGPSASRIASAARDAFERPAGTTNETNGSGSAAERAADAAEDVKRAASDTADRARHIGRSLSDTTGEYVDNAADFASGVKENVQRMGEGLQGTWRQLATEQPLVLGAIGVALGALLGAGVPSTRAEDRLMGDASDALKGEAHKEAASLYNDANETMRSGETTRSGDDGGVASEGAKAAPQEKVASDTIETSPAEDESSADQAGQEGRMAFERSSSRTSS